MEIKNVKIVNHDSTINNADIVIENKLIKSIKIKTGEGKKIIIPGFIEPHIHGFGGKDSMDSKEAVEHMSKELAKVGVTTFMPTLMTRPWEIILESLSNAAKAANVGAKIAGLHLEGPFIALARKGAHAPELLVPATIERIDQLHKASNGKLKRLVMAPEINPEETIRHAAKLGMVVALGHTDATAEEFHKGEEWGGTTCTHLWNGMSGVENRKPGVAQAALVSKELYAELICDLVHVDAESIRLAIKAKSPKRIIVISDSIRPAGLPDGEYTSGGLPVIKKGTKITLKHGGNIAGGAGSIDVGFRTLLKLGYELEDIVKMTSYNAACNQGFKQVAEVKEGYFADLVILNLNHEIEDVYVDGNKITR